LALRDSEFDPCGNLTLRYLMLRNLTLRDLMLRNSEFDAARYGNWLDLHPKRL
jgi:hypothetical protein